jgi:hypothetical protein
MSQTITGGSVAVEDGVKPQQEYAPARKVRVELTFDVGEGVNTEATLDRVSNLVNNQVRKLLHQAPEIIQARAEEALARAQHPAGYAGEGRAIDMTVLPADPVAQDAQFDERLAQKRTRRTKAEMEAARAAEVVQATAIDDFPVDEPEAPATAADLLADLPPDEEISDTKIHEALSAKNATPAQVVEIKKLIVSYRTDATKPWSASMIPQSSRPDFLAKLGEIQ